MMEWAAEDSELDANFIAAHLPDLFEAVAQLVLDMPLDQQKEDVRSSVSWCRICRFSYNLLVLPIFPSKV